MEYNNLYQLVLASQSPRRKELLNYLNIPFKILVADILEESNEKDPSLFALDIAKQKACAIDKNKKQFIISSDTIVTLGDVIYGKPKNREDAKRILLELSGKKHFVITAVCFYYFDQNGKEKTHLFYDRTEVEFDKIDLQRLENYLNTNDSLDKAGAYGIQGPSLTFISRVNGSYSNVVGFPLNLVIRELENLFGPDWRSFFEQNP
jgi:septum formation protein